MTIVPVELLGRRVARLQEAMAGAGIDTLLVTELPSVRWLTGFSGSAGRALVRPTGAAVLVTDDRYTLRAKAEARHAERRREERRKQDQRAAKALPHLVKRTPWAPDASRHFRPLMHGGGGTAAASPWAAHG